MAEELYQVLQGEPYAEFPKRLDPDSVLSGNNYPRYEKSLVEAVMPVEAQIFRWPNFLIDSTKWNPQECSNYSVNIVIMTQTRSGKILCSILWQS